MAKRKTNKSKGLGDVIENITSATGIKAVVDAIAGEECKGCNERKEALNRKYPSLKNANDLSEEQIKEWSNFKEVRTIVLDFETILWLCKLYSEIFNLPFWKPSCFGCSGTARSLSNMIDKIDLIYNNQTNEKNN